MGKSVSLFGDLALIYDPECPSGAAGLPGVVKILVGPLKSLDACAGCLHRATNDLMRNGYLMLL